jgi:AAHS family 4-hydroxybenzoate transporter-like MFS transporter
MERDNVIDVGELMENQTLCRFQILVAALGFLVFFVDGLDNSALPVSAPAILKALDVPRSALGFTFGAGSVGALIGSVLFGYFADRWGRRHAILASVLAYALTTFCSAFAHSLATLTTLRFVTGLGVAGVVPITITLLTETAPKAYRAQFVMLTLIGIAAGNGTAGLVGAALLPSLGYPAMFLTCGGFGLVLGIALFVALPESLRYLALSAPEAPELRRLVARIAPDLDLAGARFTLAQTPRRRAVALRELFAGDRRVSTLLLWIGYLAEAITFYTLLSWIVVFLTSAGLDQRSAALAFSYASAGGICSILVMSRILDRAGPAALVASAIAGLATVLAMGVPHLPHAALVALAVLAITFCTVTHNALNGTVGLYYPTALRGKGVGYATSMGRLGLSIGPPATALLLASQIPLHEVLAMVGAPYLVVAFACGTLGRIYQRRLKAGASIEASGIPSDKST